MRRKKVTAIVAAATVVAASAGALLTQNAMADANGGDNDTKIIGGGPATEDYGFVASLQYEKDGNPDHLRCGTALIEDQWVLTAAHCVVDDDGSVWDPSLLHINIGSTDNTKGEEVQVDKIESHPDYLQDTPNDGDIALLHLAEAPDAETIELGGKAEVGSDVRQIGWGRTVADDPESLPAQLQEIDSTVLKKEKCVFGDEWDITEGDICVDTFKDAGACYGDSGSPLLQKDAEGKWVTLGVVSRAGGTACLETDEVYTGVDYYKDWIKTTMDG